MSCLTENYLTFNDDEPKNPEKNNWYDRVYLCIEKKNTSQQMTNGFNCYTFANFNQADIFYKKHFTPENAKFHTMIPVCKWIPCSFHKYYLN